MRLHQGRHRAGGQGRRDLNDKNNLHVRKTLKRIHDCVRFDQRSVEGSDKSKSGDEDENIQRRRENDKEMCENPDHAEGLTHSHAFKNNMTELMEIRIRNWLKNHTRHRENAMRPFNQDFLKFKGIKLSQNVVNMGKKVWDCMLGSPTTRKRNKARNEQESTMDMEAESRYNWMPWYTVKKFMEKEDVFGNLTDHDFW